MVNEKLVQLKKRLIIVGCAFAGLVGVILGVYMLVINMQNAGKRELQRAERQVSMQNSKVVELQQKIQDFEEAEALWKQLQQTHAIREGLQFDLARQTLNELERKYHFSSPIKIDLSPSIELSDVYQTKDVTIISSNVQLRFSAVSDEFIYRFLEAMQVLFPGYINYESFEIRRVASINDEAINRIYRGELPNLVSAEVLFKWQDLKDIEKDGKS